MVALRENHEAPAGAIAVTITNVATEVPRHDGPASCALAIGGSKFVYRVLFKRESGARRYYVNTYRGLYAIVVAGVTWVVPRVTSGSFPFHSRSFYAFSHELGVEFR